MKITNIKTFVVRNSTSSDNWTGVKPFIFVKVETDEGFYGWGEAYALTDQERSLEQLIAELGRHLIGRDPLKVRKFAAYASREFAENRAGITFYIAQSSLEIALWDIAGKYHNEPVYNLLGGACRDTVRLYANFWTSTPHPTEDIADKAQEVKAQGFTAVKIYPLQCPTLADAERRVWAVREAIGPDMDLMIDLSGQQDPQYALEAARRFEPCNPYWIEEPVVSDDLRSLAMLNNKIAARVVTGERLTGMRAFREVLEMRAASMLNPDITACGGILTFLDIAAMANAFSVAVTPHNYNSMAVGMAAMLQVSALVSGPLIAEYFPYFQEMSDVVATNGFEISEGFVRLPTAAGIGIDLDEAALLEQAFESAQLRPLKG